MHSPIDLPELRAALSDKIVVGFAMREMTILGDDAETGPQCIKVRTVKVGAPKVGQGKMERA